MDSNAHDLDLGRTQLESYLRSHSDAAVAGMVSASGHEFLRWLAAFLQEMRGTRYALIGELWGEDWDRVRTVVARDASGEIENIEYDLRGTPCANVVSREFCCYQADVDELFPEDVLLKEIGAKSYVGVLLIEPGGRPLGLIVLLDDKPMTEEEIAHSQSLITLFQARAEAELVRRRAMAEYDGLLEIAGPMRVEHAVQDLVDFLARALNVARIWVSSYVDADLRQLKIEALAGQADWQVPINYSAAAGPFAQLFGGQRRFVAQGARDRYPSDPLIQEIQAEACMVTALTGRDGGELGQLVILHDRPINTDLSDHPLIRLLVARIEDAIQRRSEQQQQLELDRRMLDAQRLESLGMLAGGVAHDFNNLLAGILGNGELLQESSLDPSQSVSVQNIILASRTAADLCRQLLDFAGQRQSEMVDLQLDSLVQEMGELLQVTIPGSCALSYRMPECLPSVRADPAQIRQILLNLIRNAVDAVGQESGQILVELAVGWVGDNSAEARVAAEWLASQDFVLMRVRDSGCGFDEATRKRIFDPFYSTKSGGHGLGLAAVQGIIRSHGGALHVESEPGRGSTFAVILPVTPSAPAPQHDQLADDPRQAHILLVDDEPLVLDVTRSLLVHSGYRVSIAADGETALEVLRRQIGEIHLAIVDFSMPGMDGIETIRALRELAPSLRAMLVSGFAQEDVVRRLDPDEVHVVLAKPLRRLEMIAQVQAALEE